MAQQQHPIITSLLAGGGAGIQIYNSQSATAAHSYFCWKLNGWIIITGSKCDLMEHKMRAVFRHLSEKEVGDPVICASVTGPAAAMMKTSIMHL